jgi:hypothetical protein
MPNNTSTILELTGNKIQIAAFIDAVVTKDSNLDFNGVVPMPEELKGTTKDWGRNVDPEFSAELVSKFGFDNWYDWSVANWGTKWNAYDDSKWKNNSIWYNTAWSPATNFFINASKKFPKVKFKHSFADEGGDFLGYEIIKDGKLIEEVNLEWDSRKGKNLCRKLGIYREEE